MLKEGKREGSATSRNLIVMVTVHNKSVDMIELLKGNLMSLRPVHFLYHSLMLAAD